MIHTIKVCLLLLGSVSASSIKSVNELSAAIVNADTAAGRSVGFLSEGNYDAVASILPRQTAEGCSVADCPLIVRTYEDLEHMEAAVVAGDIIAGLSTSAPENDDGHLNEFPASLVTLRSSMLKMRGGDAATDSEMLIQAWDAAIVRAIHGGTYNAIETKYFQSNGFDSVAAFSCGVDPTVFPFPAAADATGLLANVISSGTLKVAALGPSNWGYQGGYTLENGDANPNPEGLWPEYLNAIFAHFETAYPGVTMERVWDASSQGVMNAVIAGTADLTEPYWTVSGNFDGGDGVDRARHEHMEVSCTTLGTESIFFTKGAGVESSSSSLPSWAIGVIIICAGLAVGLCVALAYLMHMEKKGTPIFKSLEEPIASKSAVNAA